MLVEANVALLGPAALDNDRDETVMSRPHHLSFCTPILLPSLAT